MSGLHTHVYTPPSGPYAPMCGKSLFLNIFSTLHNIYYTIRRFLPFFHFLEGLLALVFRASLHVRCLILPTKLRPLKLQAR